MTDESERNALAIWEPSNGNVSLLLLFWFILVFHFLFLFFILCRDK
jgi:hypothetical protein